VVSVALVLIGVSAYSQTLTTGRTTNLNFGKYEVDRVEFFDDFDLGGSIGSQTFYVYNETAGTFGTDTVTGGEVKTIRYTEAMAVTIAVPTLGSSSVDWRIEGRFGTASQYALIASGTISAATTIDEVVPIAENPEAIRVGLRASSIGGDQVDVYGLFRRKK